MGTEFLKVVLPGLENALLAIIYLVVVAWLIPALVRWANALAAVHKNDVEGKMIQEAVYYAEGLVNTQGSAKMQAAIDYLNEHGWQVSASKIQAIFNLETGVTPSTVASRAVPAPFVIAAPEAATVPAAVNSPARGDDGRFTPAVPVAQYTTAAPATPAAVTPIAPPGGSV